jgi:Holliday junction resolvase
MSGTLSRSKGQRGERELAALLTSLGLPSKRAGYSGHSCEDIEHTIDGVHLEVKYQARCNIRQAMQQAEHDGPNHKPVVMSRTVVNGGAEPWLLTMRVQDMWVVIDALQRARI